MVKKSIKVNSVLNVVKTLSSIVFPLITFPYVSRVLLPENIGKVNFSISYVSYFALIASLGITTYAIRECSPLRNDHKKLEKSASEIFSINICTTLLAYILLAISLIRFHSLERYRTLIIIQSSTIIFATFGADWLNTVFEDFGYITLRSLLFQLISLVLTFVFVRVPSDYIKYALILVVSSSGANILNALYIRRHCKLHVTFKMRWRVHFIPILLLFVMIMAQNIFNSVDVTMLGLMKSDFEVGIYSTAFKIKNIIAQVGASLCWVMMPRMSIYFAEDNWNKVNIMLRKILSIMVAIGFPCVAGCLSLSREIVTVVGGTEYGSAAGPLCILMASYAIDIFGEYFLGNMVCLPGKKEKVFMQACCAAAIINIVLNYLLIPIGGASAAALTSGLSSIVLFLWLYYKKDKRLSLNHLGRVFAAPLVGSLLIVLICLMIKKLTAGLLLTVGLSVIISVVVYASVLLIMRNQMAIIALNSFKRVVNRIRGK